MTGKEELLAQRLKVEPLYERLFPAAFPGEADPFTLGNTVKANRELRADDPLRQFTV